MTVACMDHQIFLQHRLLYLLGPLACADGATSIKLDMAEWGIRSETAQVANSSELRGRPFDSWGGGLWFFCEKKIVQQILENK